METLTISQILSRCEGKNGRALPRMRRRLMQKHGMLPYPGSAWHRGYHHDLPPKMPVWKEGGDE